MVTVFNANFFFLWYFRYFSLGKVILYITFTFSFISYTDVEDYLAGLISRISSLISFVSLSILQMLSILLKFLASVPHIH